MDDPDEFIDANKDGQKPAMTMDQLARGVQGLPGELYNQIYEYTFTFDEQTRIVTRGGSNEYHPPKLLQVDRASRAMAAQSYYRNTTFVFISDDLPNIDGIEPKSRWGEFWLRGLPKQHREALREVHLRFTRVQWMGFDAIVLTYFSFEDFDLNFRVTHVGDHGGQEITVRINIEDPEAEIETVWEHASDTSSESDD